MPWSRIAYEQDVGSNNTEAFQVKLPLRVQPVTLFRSANCERLRSEPVGLLIALLLRSIREDDV